MIGMDQASGSTTCDVAIVGAGAPGLAAARAMLLSGVDLLVLEARDRVGGRVLSQRLSNGFTIDHGGECVAPTQDRVVALARDLLLRTFPTFEDGNHTLLADGMVQRLGTDGTTKLRV